MLQGTFLLQCNYVTTTATAVANYCTSQGNSTASENIGSVDFNTISNTTSSGSGYVDYTSISTNVQEELLIQLLYTILGK
jgi:hypothetical protein